MPAVNIDSTYGVVIHKNFEILSVDDNYARIFGFESAKDLLDETSSLLDLISPTEWGLAKSNNQAMLNGEIQAASTTHANVNSTGEVITVLTLDQVIDWEGEPVLQVTVVDLTSIVKANKKILDNEKQYRELITKSAQGMVIQRDFKALLVNEAWVRLYNADSVEAVMQSSLLDRIPESYRGFCIERYNKLINGEVEGESITVENYCFDGALRTFRIYENKIEWDGKPALQTVVEDVTEKAKLEKELQYKANHDQLTDLYNRDAVFEWLENEEREFETLTCMILDIDNFKKVNDSYGHYAGDKVIKAFAHTCESVIDDKGIVGRWGGEEFLVLLPDVSAKEAMHIAERIREACAKRVCRFGNIAIKTTVSIGVCTRPNQCEPLFFDDLLKEADDRMYNAKKSGKNRVCCG
ncbi:sensor domain-containing diguanylate cyclase [Vibrio hannami]|uniref:sensor domain-containing diguanylate cyclase n=1 Tax=Vibrio hannami TaxID=2717094 RepID=UPI00241008BB|nr:sensor domain-containing diguanylate cyclase [Vibrio hannami]MDG3087478.1 sensor domain-containing diguanylate cyclase [Vibrio hannami]